MTRRPLAKNEIKELREKLTGFYSVYDPEKGTAAEVEKLIKLARESGVAAIRASLKENYGVNYDEIDYSFEGWTLLRNNLQKYFAEKNLLESVVDEKEARHRNISSDPVGKALIYTREKGVKNLDIFLKKKHNESLTEFLNKDLMKWKGVWKPTLDSVTKDRYEYELQRFENVVKVHQKSKKKVDIPKYLKHGMKRGRESLNMTLLKKYDISLDQVPVLKGSSAAERRTNLLTKLTKFYQKYDPKVLDAADARGTVISKQTSPGAESRAGDDEEEENLQRKFRDMSPGANQVSLLNLNLSLVPDSSPVGRLPSRTGSKASFDTRAFSKLKRQQSIRQANFDLESVDVNSLSLMLKEAYIGMVKYEQLNKALFNRYKANLDSYARDRLMSFLYGRLSEFYENLGLNKPDHEIREVADFGVSHGFFHMNRALVLKYGMGVDVSGFDEEDE
eukprot:snap_masked-scaffold_1-processed-gene-26.49-mRNA-1 protein AED:1.00 eAED:1.00 QI:0/-1/0/0/-1/1/1/0/447